jgi:hypothetical protein
MLPQYDPTEQNAVQSCRLSYDKAINFSGTFLCLTSNLLQNAFDHVIRLNNNGMETGLLAKLYCCGMTKWKKVAFIGQDSLVSWSFYLVFRQY